MNADNLITALSNRYREILGGNFVGLYVHGSYSMNCFNPLKSDLDYIIVCEEEPSDSSKMAVMDATIAYERFAPAKGLEMHLMLRKDCMDITWPPRFSLHYSGAHTEAYLSDPEKYVGYMKGVDPDLGAHLTVMYHRGLRVCGPELRSIFGPVPSEYYIRSVMEDLGWSGSDAMYHVLNLCRTLALARDGSVLSKKEGAVWALSNVSDKHHAVIREALECYETDRVFQPGEAARIFCEASLAEIKKLLGFSEV